MLMISKNKEQILVENHALRNPKDINESYLIPDEV